MIYADIRHQLTVYVCEDIKEHSEQLARICSSLAEEYPLKVNFFSSAIQLLQQLEQLQKDNGVFPNLIILDIELPEMDGITLGKRIKAMDADVFLVFVTSYIEYAVKGYEANAFRYLLKPLSLEVMQKLFMDIEEEYQKRKKLTVKTRDGEIMIPLQELVYISAEDKYTVLYTKTQHYISDCSLKKYEEQLREYGFFRIHRKYLINLYHHKGVQAGKVVLTNGYGLPVSKKRMSEYQRQLFHFLGEDLV
ncbi:MAG: LytTR family DNA-binding domain-containing protein [Bacteroidales bacterium]|nr:LytTR family DNA-binding domain-containing protein [Clostridium sp.]MCM1204551.1 LytTR family DNA-binding domain-containing protein [Bacteroidales bacterium]